MAVKIARDINASRLVSLDLWTSAISSPGLFLFLSHLDAPNLRALGLGQCRLNDGSVPHLTEFLRSKRGSKLVQLNLAGADLCTGSLRALVAAVRGHKSLSALVVGPHGMTPPEDWEEAKSELDAILEGNRERRARTREAVVRCIGVLRVLLCCSRPKRSGGDAGESDDSRLEGLSITDPEQQTPSPSAPNEPSRDPSRTELQSRPTPSRIHHHSRTPPPPSLLDLPEHVVLQIARNTSGDPAALSNAQWYRLVKFASDRYTIGRMPHLPAADARCTMPFTIGEYYSPGTPRRVMGLAADEMVAWLESVGCAEWEEERELGGV